VGTGVGATSAGVVAGVDAPSTLHDHGVWYSAGSSAWMPGVQDCKHPAHHSSFWKHLYPGSLQHFVLLQS